ncbi:aminotransferase class I/II-fold pyridoxal phosphate-dependent enzyme [Arenibacter sp. H213]|uniref:Aminotransferase class I/II-fold pyridoxal phosphate-dependent enzyme n=1 Tax=Arenibacter antarcticus TaxID=2040469 RepID=A0ABW5VI55_9FLAO|nr:aminotransferase class I/II-fold pyridoxal phosphate-dependent enzyme [Arenibacter sp. H213]
MMTKLTERQENNAFRKLPMPKNLIDFSSNDYLGFAKNESIFKSATQLLEDKDIRANGAIGSRLLTGTSEFHTQLESVMANFFLSKAALVCNLGYDANIGFFSAVPQRNDIVLYDELCHASIRDGINMGLAKSIKFRHNDLNDLERKLKRLEERAIAILPT